MERFAQWCQRLSPRDRALIASSLSIASGLVVVNIIIRRRQSDTVKNSSIVDTTASTAAAMGLKPIFSKRLLEVAAFKERTGHADVPLGSGNWPQGLGKWVYAQRKRKAEGTLDAAEEAALTLLGFRWRLDPDELDPDDLIERLLAYKTQTGDMLVPKKYEADPLLGAWVAAVRRKADPLLNGGESILQPELRERLDGIGFAWEPARRCGSNFMSGFRLWSEAKSAGLPVPDEKWCNLQREARRQGKLSEQRIGYLDKFGFDWNISEHA